MYWSTSTSTTTTSALTAPTNTKRPGQGKKRSRDQNLRNCPRSLDHFKAALDEWIATIPKGQKEVWSDLVRAVGNWREETMTYFETDMPVTNAYTESINRLAKDKNREGRGYSFEVMRARMLYTTKHKKKAPTAKVSPFYKKTIGYGLPDFAEELNYGVDLSTI